MKRRLLAGLLTCVMLFSLLPATALAEEDDEEPTGEIVEVLEPTDPVEAEEPDPDAAALEEVEEEPVVLAEGNVAKIGKNEYKTLDEAIKVAEDGATIELLADATTEGLNLSKDLTIQAAEGVSKPTITFTKYGIALWGKALTFKNVNVVMNGIGSTPYTPEWNWMTICASKDAALTLDNVTMTMDGDPEKTGTNMNKHAIYFCSNNKLNLTNDTVLTIQNYKQDALEWDGGDGGYNVNITDSTFISNHNRSGFTGTFYATITKSHVDVVNSSGNGSNGSHFIITDSEINFNNNISHGLSAAKLTIDNSIVNANCNGMCGIIATGETIIRNKAAVTIKENKVNVAMDSRWARPGALTLKGKSTISNDSTVTITDNEGCGIYLWSSSASLTMGSGTVQRNHAVKAGKGGGIYNEGTCTLADTVQLYNNHAGTAGDDIYNANTAIVYNSSSKQNEIVDITAAITFARTASDWYLDGDPDCNDPIDGWYDDAENNRWEAHAENENDRHIVPVTPPVGYAATGLLALKAAHGYIEPAPIVPKWETSKSKTATNLEKQSDGTYTSDVTLSLPAAEEPLVTDVVFVLDKSTSAALEDQALKMLEDLKNQLDETKAKINVGVVIFNKVANVANGGNFYDLSTHYEDIKTAITQNISSGTNMHAGLLAGKAMLDSDEKVDASRKYLILVSDGMSYYYCKNGDYKTAYTICSLNGGNDGNGNGDCAPMSGIDCWDIKYGAQYCPNSWAAWMADVKALTNNYSTYEYEVGSSDIPKEKDSEHAVSYQTRKAYPVNADLSLTGAYDVYQAAVKDGYHCYAVKNVGNTSAASYPYGPSFMDYLANGEKVSFGKIKNDIYYLLDAGSTVVDYMGYDTYGTNTYYDFDFVDSADKLVLKVGDAEYKTTKVESGLANGETARYVFNYSYVDENGETVEVKATNKAEAPFVLHYYAGEGKSEHFVWDINVPVSQFETVQLTYTVKLTNPETDIGTYGEYDEDGSKNKEALYTNNSATLYPIDSDGHKVESEDFPKPTVSYTVGETGTLTVTKRVLTSTPNADEEFHFTVTYSKDGKDTTETFTLKNGETWKDDVPFGTKYSVTENESGYVPYYLGNQQGAITMNAPTAAVTVANVRNDEAALFISKTVKNSTTTQEFTFTVTLTDADGNPLTGTCSYTNSKTTDQFVSGGTVKLASGNSAVIYGLPAGVIYKVTETPVTNYTTSSVTTGVTGTDTDNVAEGTIAAGVVTGVHYTNTYTKPSTPSGGSSGGGSPVLNTDDHYSYIIGYKDGYLRPYGTITRGEVATIFFRLLTDEARDKYWSQTNDYSDCNSDLWCNNAISTLSNMGIIDGYTDGTFRPYGKITRAQFAKIAVGFFETTKKEYQGYYSDVPENAWFTDYVEAASRVGLIQGFEDGTFRPNTNITRAQACVIVNRALNRKPDEDHLLPEKQMVTWPDNNPGDWYYADMQEATNSHDYTWLSKGSEKKYMEDWTKKLEQRDWAAFEHAWSTAHSAPGGEVVK